MSGKMNEFSGVMRALSMSEIRNIRQEEFAMLDSVRIEGHEKSICFLQIFSSSEEEETREIK